MLTTILRSFYVLLLLFGLLFVSICTFYPCILPYMIVSKLYIAVTLSSSSKMSEMLKSESDFASKEFELTYLLTALLFLEPTTTCMVVE